MIETLLGGLLGGLFRLTPEALKAWDRHQERQHELAMQDKALAFEHLRGPERMAEIDDVHPWPAPTQPEPAPDAFSARVRPAITYAFLGFYAVAKATVLIAALEGNETALAWVWTEADQALWAGVLNFWFIGRIYERGSR